MGWAKPCQASTSSPPTTVPSGGRKPFLHRRIEEGHPQARINKGPDVGARAPEGRPACCRASTSPALGHAQPRRGWAVHRPDAARRRQSVVGKDPAVITAAAEHFEGSVGGAF